MKMMLSTVMTRLRARGHDVGRRVNRLSRLDRLREHSVVTLNIEIRETRWSKVANEKIPRFDFVEELEEKRSKEDFLWRLVAVVNHVANEVLTYSIGSAINVCEPILAENWIFGPGKQ